MLTSAGAYRANPAVVGTVQMRASPVQLGMAEQVVSVRQISRDELRNTGRLFGKDDVASQVPRSLGAGSNFTMTFNATKYVATAWEQVHASLPDPNARVPRDVFVQYCIRTSPLSYKNVELYCSYLAYVNSLFDNATAMMLPAQKTDLGKHCFGYAVLMASEFYWGQPADRLCLTGSERPQDQYAQIRSELDLDWSSVAKDSEGRVPFEAFRDYFVAKYSNLLIQETVPCYIAFLKKNFCACLSMMLPKLKDTLGGHCFRYGAMIAGEFYFDAASSAVIGMSTNPRPVLDVLAITK